MSLRSASRLTDLALSHELDELCASDRSNTAQLLIHIGEFDRRKLHLPAGYPSMFQYCAQKCHMSEGAAYRRIRAARAARQYRSILSGITNGSLNLTTVVLLTPYLTPDNSDELLNAAAHKGRTAIELLIAQRFPRRDVPTLVEPVKCQKLTPASVETLCALANPAASPPKSESAAAPVNTCAALPTPSRVAPLAPERFGLQTTIDQETHDLLRRAQDLLGHLVQSGDVASVLKRALAALVSQLEKKKFAGSHPPRSRPRRASASSRHLPLHVRKAVWERDGGQCTFVGEGGHQCQERRGLEFDHVEPIARGGTATVGNIRLRCPAHNQYEAERLYGSDFMEHKREAARERRSERNCGAVRQTAG